MRVPMFGIGLFSKSPNVTTQKRINLYYEFSAQEDKTAVAVYGTPGLELFVDFGDTPVRGQYAIGNSNYVVHRGTLYKVNNAGVTLSLGVLDTTSGKVSMSDNGVQLMIVDGTSGYILTLATDVFAKITDVDFFANPTTVAFLAGYFICTFLNSGRFQISAIRDGLTWDALDFANAETNPDNLVRVYADHGELILLGEYTTEFWGVSGALDFPFSYISGSSIEWGLVSAYSIAKNEDSIVYVARNRMGESRVVMLRGYTPTVVSGQDLDFIINQYTAIEDAVAFGYMLGGHPFYQVSFPTGDQTWLYDQSTNVWSQLISNDLNRHRSELHTNFLNQNVVSDYSNGRLYKLKPEVYTDNGEMIARELIGRHVYEGLDNLFISELQIDMQTGVGLSTGQGSNPQVMLQISKDGGNTWGNELWRSAGAIGVYLTRVIWRRLGKARDWNFKIRITDPVKVVIIGAYLDMVKGK